MRLFQVTTEGTNKLNLRQICEDFAIDAWIPDHLTPEQAAAFVLGSFKRTVLGELELLTVSSNEK